MIICLNLTPHNFAIDFDSNSLAAPLYCFKILMIELKRDNWKKKFLLWWISKERKEETKISKRFKRKNFYGRVNLMAHALCRKRFKIRVVFLNCMGLGSVSDLIWASNECYMLTMKECLKRNISFATWASSMALQCIALKLKNNLC